MRRERSGGSEKSGGDERSDAERRGTACVDESSTSALTRLPNAFVPPIGRNGARQLSPSRRSCRRRRSAAASTGGCDTNAAGSGRNAFDRVNASRSDAVHGTHRCWWREGGSASSRARGAASNGKKAAVASARLLRLILRPGWAFRLVLLFFSLYWMHVKLVPGCF